MMIEVENLTRYFGPVLAVDHINFSVDKGEVVGFLGLNGAGKTTTMRILTTYLPATSGIARVAGHDVMTESMKVRENIGYLPENVPLYPEMRVEEYLQYRARLKQVERSARQKRIDYVLERCRIREVSRRLMGTLSKGYRQRVGLADALVHDPKILILDEPTAGLDPLQKRETLDLIKELSKDHTIMLSTHILSEVEATCHRVIIIYSGRIGLAKRLSELNKDAVIVVEARGPGDKMKSALTDIKGIDQVEIRKLGNGLTGLEISTTNQKDLREEISTKLSKNEWAIRRLDLRSRSLEDHFLSVMRDEDPLRHTETEQLASE